MKFFRLLMGVSWVLAGFCVRGGCDSNQPADVIVVSQAPQMIANSKISPNDSKPDAVAQAPGMAEKKATDTTAEDKGKITDAAVLNSSDLSDSKE